MAVWLSLAVNDENGDLTGWCERIEVEIAGETAMQIECELPFAELTERRIKIGDEIHPYFSRATCVGSMVWNNYAVPMVNIVLLLNRLKENPEVGLIEAWTPLFEKWESIDRITHEDFDPAPADSSS